MINYMKPKQQFLEANLESEYALWLSNARPDDPGVLEALVERYAPHLYCLADALVPGSDQADHRLDELLPILRSTFRQAVRNLQSFRGQESVRSWLFGQTIHAARKIHLKRRQKSCRKREFPGSNAQWPWQIVDYLPREERLALVLRYRHGFSLVEISATLKHGQKDVHQWLVAARQKLFEAMPKGGSDPTAGEDHKEWARQLYASLDGLLEDDLRARRRLSDHLAQCPACQIYQERLFFLEEHLMQTFGERWIAPEIDSNQWNAYILEHSDSGGRSLSKSTAKTQPAVVKTLRDTAHAGLSGEFLWLSGTLLVLLALAWYFIREDTHKGKPLFEATPAAPAPILQASSSLVQSLPNDRSISEVRYHPYEGRLSADGRWLAFSVNARQLVEGQPIDSFQVMLLDLDSERMERISPSGSLTDSLATSSSVSGIHNSWNSYMPAISADGQLVVFTSNAPIHPGEKRTPCLPNDENNYCYHIYLYNRQTGTTERISQTSRGEPANGHSLMPTLSPNGRWVAFWSNARNLTDFHSPFCSFGGKPTWCYDLYMYDRQTKRGFRVAIGRQFDLLKGEKKPELSSISANGRYLALTVYKDDMISEPLGLHEESEVFIYDRVEDTFEPANLSSDREPGNGASANPGLSANGRYIAFASLADNLVPGDTNNKADVFIRDRLKSQTTIASIASDGTPGNNDSGAFMGSLSMWPSLISISNDGGRAIFLSTADNLDTKSNFRCSTQGWIPCSQIYVHNLADGQTQAMGITQAIIAQQQLNALYHSPALSGDGRYASFLQQDLECPRGPLCAMFLIGDLQENRLHQAFNANQLATYLHSSGQIKNPLGLVDIWSSPEILRDVTGRVNSLSFSPDGGLLAGGGDNGVSIWQVETGGLVQRDDTYSLPVNSVAFSPDGTLLASAGSDGRVNLYGLPSGHQRISLNQINSPILSLAFSQDGKVLAAGRPGLAWTWDLQDLALPVLDYFEYPEAQINRIAFSPDGNLLAHASSDGTVWLRRAQDGQVIARLGGHQDRVLSLAFSPDGHWLASGSGYGRVNLWWIVAPPDPGWNRWLSRKAEADSGWVIENRLILIHNDWVNDLSFSPDGTILATASMDRGVTLWRIPSGERLETPLETRWDQALSLAFSPDGRQLAIASAWGGVRLWQPPESLWFSQP